MLAESLFYSPCRGNGTAVLWDDGPTEAPHGAEWATELQVTHKGRGVSWKEQSKLVKKVFFKEENTTHTTEFYALGGFLYKCCFEMSIKMLLTLHAGTSLGAQMVKTIHANGGRKAERWWVTPSHFCLALVCVPCAFGTWFTISTTVALLNIKNDISWALTNHGEKQK